MEEFSILISHSPHSIKSLPHVSAITQYALLAFPPQARAVVTLCWREVKRDWNDVDLVFHRIETGTFEVTTNKNVSDIPMVPNGLGLHELLVCN